MRLSNTSRRKVSINVTSLIDVVFLLLIFFVVTSTFLERPGLDLSLPEASSAEVAAQKEVTVQIEEGGGIVVDGEAVDDRSGLVALIEARLEQSEKRRVVLEADERVSHGNVVEVMDAARQAGASGIVIATRPGEDDGGP